MVLYIHSLTHSTVWSLLKHKDKFTFTYCKIRWHYILHLTGESKKNVITSQSTPKFEKELTTSYPWLGVHVLDFSPPFDSTESRRHKLCQKDPTCHQNDTFSRMFLAQGGSSLYILSPHHVNKRTINDTTFCFGIIKKKEKESKRKHLSCLSCKLCHLIPNH
jgi:hypothetical protein